MSHQYFKETFTDEERAKLAPYFTNLDGPVFALTNLPEVVKSALFARYSRSPKSLRRLFLDEFIGDLEVGDDVGLNASAGLDKANDLYDRVFLGFGDDSVAQLGGAHLACEQASNILTKVLERGRLASYLEQSTRYIPYGEKRDGRFLYYMPDGMPSYYRSSMDSIMESYNALFNEVLNSVRVRYPQGTDSTAVWNTACRSKALDASRDLLPAAVLSNLGIYGSGQAYESLLIRMAAHPLSEVREYGKLMLIELRKVIPNFMARVDLPDRGLAWSAYIHDKRESVTSELETLYDAYQSEVNVGMWDIEAQTFEDGELHHDVKLIGYVNGGVATRIIMESMGLDITQAGRFYDWLSSKPGAVKHLIKTYAGDRSGNRRLKPGRAFEAMRYSFQVVSDYGAFRDLQRHRMLTIEWQRIGTSLGYAVPPEVLQAGKNAISIYHDAMAMSHTLYKDLEATIGKDQAQYAVSMGYKMRYIMDFNAREATHMLELRSSPQAHPSYKWIAQEMWRQINSVTPEIAQTMIHMGHDESANLERLESERRAEAKFQEANKKGKQP